MGGHDRSSSLIARLQAVARPRASHVGLAVPLLPHHLQRSRTREDRAGPLGGLRIGLCVLLRTLRWRAP
jgi:hypothetical protein